MARRWILWMWILGAGGLSRATALRLGHLFQNRELESQEGEEIKDWLLSKLLLSESLIVKAVSKVFVTAIDRSRKRKSYGA